jgi:hypothetical protein
MSGVTIDDQNGINVLDKDARFVAWKTETQAAEPYMDLPITTVICEINPDLTAHHGSLLRKRDCAVDVI